MNAIKLLIFEKDLPAVTEAAAGMARPVLPICMDVAGRIHIDGAEISDSDCEAEAAWHSFQTFRHGLADRFIAAAIDCPTLRWLQTSRAGYDDPTYAALARNGVRVTTNDAPALAIAEYVLAGVLDVFQRGADRRLAQQEERWQPIPFREIAGSRWLILGFGSIGREVALRARVFGAHVTGARRSGGSDPLADAMVTPGTMDAALAEADVVILSVPLGQATADMADAGFFDRMKPGALLVNVGRGGLLDEPALRAALDAGKVGHAILDVAKAEPLPAGDWMWRHPGVTLTAHTSGYGSGIAARSRALFVDNLARYAAGRTLRNEVPAEALLGS